MMKKKLLLLTILTLVTANWLLAQNSDPVVENVTALQRSDNSMIVDIYYDVNDADGDDLTITLQVSNDDGATYDMSCIEITGDVGSPITSGTGKHIIWDLGREHPPQADELIFKISAEDGQEGVVTVTDYDGNVYQTVQIGNQLWMASNLKVTHYRNGDLIPTGHSDDAWKDLDNTNTGAYCVYDNLTANANTYGNLYNWYAVNDSRNIAPAGWHVPTDEEIKILEIYLGMSQTQADNENWRGTNEGSKLAGSADLWADGSLKGNASFGNSGFNFLPGGYRYQTGSYNDLGDSGYFWSSSVSGSIVAWHRKLSYNYPTIYRNPTSNMRRGYSVRCVRD